MSNFINSIKSKDKMVITLLSGAILTGSICSNVYLINQINTKNTVIVEQAHDIATKTADFTKLQKSTSDEINKLIQINNKNNSIIDKLTKENKELKNRLSELHIKPFWSP